MTPENFIAQQLREELNARVNAWKAELSQLEKAQAQSRISELRALIAYADDETKTSYPVAPKERERQPDVPPRNDTDNPGRRRNR